jgi:rare lipoprotein A
MQKLPQAALAVRLFAAFSLCFFVTGSVHAEPTQGWASYYKHGKRTANGERFNPSGLTAAHRTLPFGTKVRVKNERTGKSVVVRINDRGPFIKGRIIDLSEGAASQVGLVKSGVDKVSIEVLKSKRAKP